MPRYKPFATRASRALRNFSARYLNAETGLACADEEVDLVDGEGGLEGVEVRVSANGDEDMLKY